MGSLNKQSGSFFFIATLIVDLELEYDVAFAGTIAVPAGNVSMRAHDGAIAGDKVVDGSKCISFTIELKGQLIPENMKGQFEIGCSVAIPARMHVPGTAFPRPHKNRPSPDPRHPQFPHS